MAERKHETEMLILGDGVTGLSIAYHCAAAGIDVVLLQPDDIETAAARTAGTVRGYFPGKPHDSRLAIRGLAELRPFGSRADSGFLTVLAGRRHIAELIGELPAQRAAGVEMELLTPEETLERNPLLAGDGIAGGIWCAQTCQVDAAAVVRGYAKAAAEHGARVCTGVTVTGVDSSAHRVTCTTGTITADTIVIAAGPRSGDLAALAGVPIPVWAQFAELMLTDPLGAGDVGTPFTFHPVAGLKTLGVGRSLLVGLERISQREDLRLVWFREAEAELARRYRLGKAALHSTWTGTFDVTPASSPIIDRGREEHAHLLFAAGYGGQTLVQAPESGRLIRDLFLGRSPDIDLAPFSLSQHQSTPATVGWG
ncbi:NAD(P)/FAD-dependent oxidoreductase [Sciscionella sediminilitoris]|uniref:NAD(P)/FAD-dependent oxidoreductase n=1 Tax=Sciscionella sediminilitoris TaxID=1445613 RepID=UPI0004DF974C|nr:FAD-dependent oxidoreductase [Sciscionella sp. SE31]